MYRLPTVLRGYVRNILLITTVTDTDSDNNISYNINDNVIMIIFIIIPGFTFTVVDEFRRFLSQFSINFHEILHTLFSIHVVTTLKVSRSFDKYLKS